jgi:hypothetical protein
VVIQTVDNNTSRSIRWSYGEFLFLQHLFGRIDFAKVNSLGVSENRQKFICITSPNPIPTQQLLGGFLFVLLKRMERSRMGFVMDGTPIEAANDQRRGGGGIGFGLEAEYDPYDQNGEDENEGGDYDDDGDYEEEDGEGGVLSEESVVPVMPDEFYTHVDDFLNRPPPKFKGLQNQNKSKMREKLEEKIIKSSSLPVILPPSKPKKVGSKIDTGRKNGPGRKVDRKIDSDLLQQAFEYTARLEREVSLKAQDQEDHSSYSSLSKGKKSSSAPHISQSSGSGRPRGGGGSGSMGSKSHRDYDDDDEEDEEEEEEENEIYSCDRKQMKFQQAYQQSKAGPSEAGGGGRGRGAGGGKSGGRGSGRGKGKKGAGTTSGSGMVKRLRSQTFTHQTNESSSHPSAGGSFDTSISHSDGGSHRQVLDFNALVANFEQGLTLKQLKQDLEDSRASMAKSKKAVDEISKEMSTKMRF